MYWQVYLHKTAVSAERLIINLIKRAQHLAQSTGEIHCSESLRFFLETEYTVEDFSQQPGVLQHYGQLDDNDVWGAIKLWQHHPDVILSKLCKMLLHRQLFRIKLGNEPVNKAWIENLRDSISNQYGITRADSSYLWSAGAVSNEAYMSEGKGIHILMKDGSIRDIAQASDLPNIKAMSKIVKKSYLCWPKTVSLPQV
jgi:hypothetical protein